MDIFISNIEPFFIPVLSGKSKMIIVALNSIKAFEVCFLRFTNLQVNSADLRANGPVDDIVFSVPITVPVGDSQHSATIQFLLAAPLQQMGAIIGMDITVVDIDDKFICKALSDTKTASVSIAAI